MGDLHLIHRKYFYYFCICNSITMDTVMSLNHWIITQSLLTAIGIGVRVLRRTWILDGVKTRQWSCCRWKRNHPYCLVIGGCRCQEHRELKNQVVNMGIALQDIWPGIENIVASRCNYMLHCRKGRLMKASATSRSPIPTPDVAFAHYFLDSLKCRECRVLGKG